MMSWWGWNGIQKMSTAEHPNCWRVSSPESSPPLATIASRVFQHPGSFCCFISYVADGSIRSSWNCWWPTVDWVEQKRWSSERLHGGGSLVSRPRGSSSPVIHPTRWTVGVGSNVLNLLANQIWWAWKPKGPSKGGFTVTKRRTLWIFSLFFFFLSSIILSEVWYV